MSWGLLHVVAWMLGLKAALDLRREGGGRGITARLFSWAVAFCLVMELAMLGAPLFAGLALLSPVSGIVAGLLLAAAVAALDSELAGRPPRAPGLSDGAIGVAMGAVSLFALVGPALAPRLLPIVAELAAVVEGGIWLAVSIVGLRYFATRRTIANDHELASLPKGLALAFAFALAGSLLTPFERATGIELGEAPRALSGTLFVLTTVMALYTAIRSPLAKWVRDAVPAPVNRRRSSCRRSPTLR